MFMSGGVAISCGSKLQEVVALSSAMPEFMAISHAIQEGLYLRMLHTEMGVDVEEGGILLLLDNQSSIKLAKKPVYLKRSKHITIRFHFSRERTDVGDFKFLKKLVFRNRKWVSHNVSKSKFLDFLTQLIKAGNYVSLSVWYANAWCMGDEFS